MTNAENIRVLNTFKLQEVITLENQLQKIRDDSAKIFMTEIEEKEYDIMTAAKERAKAQIDAEQQRRGGLALSQEEAQKYYDAAANTVKKLTEAERERYNTSREWSTDWRTAFIEYVDNATNAANSARETFNTVINSMNSAIDNFVNTGKFNFADFATSIIKDLLRIELKLAAMQMIRTSGIGSFLGIPGFANGGTIGTNGPVLVGERGPEIISGAAGRTVIPNHELGNLGSGQPVYNYYNTYNNNISAIDSKSVAQLFAENRQVLFGNVEQARKEMPMRMR